MSAARIALLEAECGRLRMLLLKAEAERDKARAEAGWQPIETAPRDGTEFLAHLSNGCQVILSAPASLQAGSSRRLRYLWWHGGCGMSVPVEETHPEGTFDHSSLRATHWRPLPPPPGD